ncbi:MAG: hydrogenase nickel incorporation protein HypB [Polyangiales bacterium]
MCTVCGCQAFGKRTALAGAAYREKVRAKESDPNAPLDYGAGPAGVHVPGLEQERIVAIEEDVLGRNDAHAARVRERLRASRTLALNFVSSPGSGKTTLLVALLERLAKEGVPLAVIEGDQQTSRDADRIRATGVPALQINTGKGCHLDASMIERALERLPPPEGGVLFVENVGNLVCPAAFDLGEAAKVVVLSVTEGDDKPLKYPDMFAASSLLLLNKIDLLPYVAFDVETCCERARRIHPGLGILPVSATTGDGLDAFLVWLGEQRKALFSTLA